MEREDGTTVSLFYDQVGSLRAVADAGGNVIKEVLYDPFGGIVKDSNPDLRFVRFGWRDYETFTSRWTAPDPIGGRRGRPARPPIPKKRGVRCRTPLFVILRNPILPCRG